MAGVISLLAALAVLMNPAPVVMGQGSNDSQNVTGRIQTVNANLDDAITLACSPRSDPNFVYQYWIFPDLSIVRNTGHHTFNDVPFEITTNYTIEVDFFEVKHSGTFICYGLDNTSMPHTPVYYGHVLQLYRPTSWDLFGVGTAVGLIAAAVCLVFFAIACLIYHKRWERSHGDSDADSDGSSKAGSFSLEQADNNVVITAAEKISLDGNYKGGQSGANYATADSDSTAKASDHHDAPIQVAVVTVGEPESPSEKRRSASIEVEAAQTGEHDSSKDGSSNKSFQAEVHMDIPDEPPPPVPTDAYMMATRVASVSPDDNIVGVDTTGM